MGNNGKVLFYFRRHEDHRPDIATPTFQKLVARSKNVFLEGVTNDLTLIDSAEENWNACIKENSLSGYKFDAGDQGTTEVIRALLGTQKRLVLERTAHNGSDFNRTFSDSMVAGLSCSLERLAEYQGKILRKLMEDEGPREDDVAEQIYALEGTTLVVFGAYHTRLEELVSQQRSTEIHKPYRKYCTTDSHLQLIRSFRETGTVGLDLSLRSLSEFLVYRAVDEHYKRFTCNEKEVLANHYASRFTLDQILDHRETFLSMNEDYKRTAKGLISTGTPLRPGLRLRSPYFKAFKQICQKYDVPLPEDLPKKVLKGATW